MYVDGAWDLFHAGHVAVLRQAKTYGDYVIVGVHDDAEVNRVWGAAFPIMNLQERALSVLGCKFADDVLIISNSISSTTEISNDLRAAALARGLEQHLGKTKILHNRKTCATTGAQVGGTMVEVLGPNDSVPDNCRRSVNVPKFTQKSK